MEPKLRIPKAVSILIVIFFFTPFVCLFLPSELAMDRDYSHPYLAYTTPLALMAPLFFYVPILIMDSFKLSVGIWFYCGAFLQSLFLTLTTIGILWLLLRSRSRQLNAYRDQPNKDAEQVGDGDAEEAV